MPKAGTREQRPLKALPHARFGIDRAALRSAPGGTQRGGSHIGTCARGKENPRRGDGTKRNQWRSVDCPAIDGIIEEAEEVAGEVEDKNVLDAALIAAAQAVEHYEMTRYGTLIAWAKTLGRNDCADVLRETLDEEEAADKKLTKIAEGGVNRAAL